MIDYRYAPMLTRVGEPGPPQRPVVDFIGALLLITLVVVVMRWLV